jgi:uncharacterized membrane protein YGL010W
MKTLTEQLAQYAAYHRHPRNILTHFAGIPMIVAAITVLLSKPSIPLGGFMLSPAVIVTIAVLIFYFLLDIGFGILMTLLFGADLWFGSWSAAQSIEMWLAIGLGGFTVGWLLQFIGHYYEGRKPAFVDDLIGLLIGPLFVVAEVLFMLGLCQILKRDIETRAGAVRYRNMS